MVVGHGHAAHRGEQSRCARRKALRGDVRMSGWQNITNVKKQKSEMSKTKQLKGNYFKKNKAQNRNVENVDVLAIFGIFSSAVVCCLFSQRNTVICDQNINGAAALRTFNEPNPRGRKEKRQFRGGRPRTTARNPPNPHHEHNFPTRFFVIPSKQIRYIR